jgi:hypothetical protein
MERRNSNLLQAIDKRLERLDRRPRRRVNRSEAANHPPQPPSITDELRAYLAGRESFDDGRL